MRLYELPYENDSVGLAGMRQPFKIVTSINDALPPPLLECPDGTCEMVKV